jgi:hypothetical protein
MSSPLVFLSNFIPFVSWGWLWAQFNSILGLFEFRFACLHLFHSIPRAIHDEIKQAFRLPYDQIV